MTETSTTVRRGKNYHHGRSPAGWIGASVALVGFLVGAAGFMLGLNWTLIWIGGAVVVASLLVTAALRALGFGQA